MTALRLLIAAVLAAAALAGPASTAQAAGGAVVLAPKTTASRADVAAAVARAGLRPAQPIGGGSERAATATGTDLRAALRSLRAEPAVAWASADRVARIADYIPNDTGRAATSGPSAGWTTQGWDLAGPFGIRAPLAWTLSQRATPGRSGGRGVIVAVLDTGVAYADRSPFRRSPDLPRARFVRGYDFVARDSFPSDANGHGTFVATTIAGSANNRFGMPGIAYSARIMPVRVLDAAGEGSSARIAQGIRFAVAHGAQVINVSIELFDPILLQPQSITSAPEIRAALRVAAAHRVTVVAATGNSASPSVPSATLGFTTINVGGTTEHGCLGDYSNHGPGMDLVAPGGGRDATVIGDPHCRPAEPAGRNIEQVTFRRGAPRRFIVPTSYKGTSMAAPHVTGVVALMLGSGRFGRKPKPTTLEKRLKATALDLGDPGRDGIYGSGLLDAAAAMGAGPQPPSP